MSQRSMVMLSALEPWSIDKNIGAPSLFETLKGYARAGWRIDYLTSYKRANQGGSHERDVELDLSGTTTTRFHLPALPRTLGSRVVAKLERLDLFSRYAAKALRHHLTTHGTPNVIYAYEEAAVAAVARLRRRGIVRCPVVHRFQGTILGERYASLLHCLRKYESWRALRCKADLYIMTDDGTLGDRALRYWNRDTEPGRLLFIRNGIDKKLFHSVPRDEALEQLGLPHDRIYLLSVSRLAGWKRVDRAIRIMAGIKERFPDARLLICGDGECRHDLEMLTRSLGVSEFVQFLGAQPRDVISKLMSAADVFLSLYDVSNCGNPLFEAMLSGCAIVTLDNGGTGTVIKDGNNGLLVPLDREAELPTIVGDLLGNEGLRRQIAQGAKEWAMRELRTWEQRMQMEVEWLEEKLRALSC